MMFRYVVFLSGIALDSDLTRNENTCLALTQLMDWIYGCGSDEVIARLFIYLFCKFV
jgi:hypothetical protein